MFNFDKTIKMNFLIILGFLQISNGFNTYFQLRGESAWKEFKSTFGKGYENHEHELQKKNVFMKNLIEIENFNSENHSYKKGINEFSDMTYEESIKFLGIRDLKPMARNESPFISNTKISPNVPKEIDWRKNNGKNYVTPVRTQGSCTASWAISALETLESQYFIKGTVTELTPLSVQQLIDCERRNCKGGLVVDAYLYVFANGTVPDASYPYKSTDGKANDCTADTKKSVGKIKHMKMLTNEAEVIEALATIGPVSVYSCLPQSLMAYKSGIYDDPACNPYEDNSYCQIFQPMTVVGYGTEKDVDFWIVKNCWGTGWGEEGYARIARKDDRCSIAFFATYPLV